MSHRVSSFPADVAARDTRPWFREPWPWLLMSGPFLVVIASLASAWIAVKTDDGVVAQDYYKQGLLINERLRHAAPDPECHLGATVTLSDSGAVRARLEGLATAPRNLRLKLARPAQGSPAEVVALTPGADGDYVGALPAQGPGRWIATLEADGWQLPTTTGVGRVAEIRLGAADTR